MGGDRFAGDRSAEEWREEAFELRRCLLADDALLKEQVARVYELEGALRLTANLSIPPDHSCTPDTACARCFAIYAARRALEGKERSFG